MIAYLKGVVVDRGSDSEVTIAIASVGYCIGYRVLVDARGTRENDEIELWIYSITREQGTTLYGFETRAERKFFVDLLEVEGVGPKTAMAVISSGVNVRDLAKLRTVKGIGKQTAEKIRDAFAGAA